MNGDDAPRYTLRDGEAVADRHMVLGIWAGNLGQDARMPAKYDWFYLQSPHGPPLMQLLHHGARAVGACAAGLRELTSGVQPIRAGVVVDLAVLPEHRSLGPAILLQQGLVAVADRQLDLLYGFPNPKAAPVFKRMGYTHVADMVRYVRVLRHGAYLERHLPGGLAHAAGAVVDSGFALRDRLHASAHRKLRVVSSNAADERMSALCMQHPLPGVVTCKRSLAHLEWRLDRAPQGPSHYLSFEDADSERLLAWACWRDDGRVATVLDFWSEVPERGFPPDCIEELCNTLRRAGHESVQVEMATSQSRLAPWQAGRFAGRGMRPIFMRWRDPLEQIPHMHITSVDEDE